VQLRGFADGYHQLGHRVTVLSTASRPRCRKSPIRLIAEADFIQFLYHGIWNRKLVAVWSEVLRQSKPYGVTFEGHPKVRMGAGEARQLRSFLLSAAWTSALTAYSANEILKRLPYLESLPIVPNGLDQRVIDLVREQRLPSPPPARPFVFCAARQVPYKGIDLLLWAWKDIAVRFPDVQLLVVGRIGHRRHYRRLADILKLGDRVRLLGKIDHSRVCALMQTCLFFVLPSREESFGFAALEAMAFGKAVLATATGPSAFIRDGKSGILIAPNDIAALTRGMARLLTDRDLRANLGRHAKKTALRYRWKKSARCFEHLIAHTAKKSGIGFHLKRTQSEARDLCLPRKESF
jgi:glycogen(starch) synthase